MGNNSIFKTKNIYTQRNSVRELLTMDILSLLKKAKISHKTCSDLSESLFPVTGAGSDFREPAMTKVGVVTDFFQ